MDLSKFVTAFFGIAIIIIIYLIIFFSLRIMYKDVKNGDKKRRIHKKLGLEVVSPGENKSLKKGGIVPLNSELTMGRKEDNLLVLTDPYVSGHHVKIYIRNTDYIIEDLGSTNGTLINEEKLDGSQYLNSGDEIKVGSAVFKVIG